MTETCRVARCDRPVGDAFMCQTCADSLRRDLAAVPSLAVELETTRARQVRFGDPVGARLAGAQGLPYDPRATEAIYVLRSALVGWVRMIAEESGTKELPLDTLAGLANWLRLKTEWLRHHEAGCEAVDEIGAAVQFASRIVDRPAERWYAGPCDNCQTDLYARSGVLIVTCECGDSYDVTERREWLLDSVADVLATATEISRALTSLDTPITAERIRQWRQRGQILPHATTTDGHPLYRIGDVLVLKATMKVRRTA